MTSNLVVFVEGKSDKRLLCCLVKHVGISELDVRIIDGGVFQLRNLKNNIDIYHNRGCRVVVILDADRDVKRRRKECHEEKEKYKIKIDEFFLIPDNRSPGNLETLLMAMATTPHCNVYNCLSQYKNCLANLSSSYNPPNAKARVYAYCDVIGAETDGKRRNYGDAEFWNLDTPALDPLKNFLRRQAKMPPPEDTD